ncbi:MAG TPA: hypothetical protein VLK29_06800 [Luteimonas sp.]|nr:hypothetical protein [Luteimonas sp.]
MSQAGWIWICAVHSAGFALFHLAFWRLFNWPASLRATTRPNRAILQIANLQLVVVFAGVAAMCVAFPGPLGSSPLGRALLGGMALFWAVRLVGQFIWLRVHHPLVHALSALFALGVVAFGVAASG